MMARVGLLLTTTIAALCMLPAQAHAAVCNAETSTTRTICVDTATYPHIMIQFSLTAGNWEFITSDLKNIPGLANPTIDPMMWLLDSSGAVIAIDDDSGPGWAPYIQKTVTSPTGAILLIAAANDAYLGTLDLEMRRNGVVVQSHNDRWFGGWRRTNHRVELSDRMFQGFPAVGGLRSGTPGDNLIVLTSSASTCTSNCGLWQMADWTVGAMSQLSIANASTTATVLGASWFQNSWNGTRWVHSRLGAAWGNSQPYTDADCDGLTYEIEGLTPAVPGFPNHDIRTCDTPTGPSTDCASGLNFSTRGQSLTGGTLSGVPFEPWNARDTDNDGLRDDWELYGVRMRCPISPVAPFFNAGSCVDDTFRYTRRDGVVCGGSVPNTFTTTNALSTHEITPRDYTVLLEVAIDAAQTIPNVVSDLAMRVFSEEGLECQENDSTTLATDCSGTVPDFIDLRILPTNTGVSDAEVLTDAPRLWYGFGNFNKSFSPNRKYTNSFFYANLIEDAGPQMGEGFRRTFVMTRGAQLGDGYVFVHELGHNLDLRHNNARNSGSDFVLNYPSLMNYKWTGAQPRKSDPAVSRFMFPSDYGAACTSGATCVGGSCRNNTCAILCDFAEARLSRGTNAQLRESSPGENEGGRGSKLAAEIACDPNIYDAVPNNEWRVSCIATIPPTCAVNWNRDADFTDVGVTGNDYDFDGNTVDIVRDEDDWDRIYAFGKHQLKHGFQPRFRAFASDFETTSPVDRSPFATPMSSASVAVVSSVSAAMGNALDFNGTTSSVSIGPSTTLQSIDVQVDPSVTPAGFRFDAFFRIDATSNPVNGSQIAHSNLFELFVSTAGTLFATLNTGSGLTTATSIPNVPKNQWFWVSLVWRKADGLVRLSLTPFSGGAWQFGSATCNTATRVSSNQVNLSTLTIGNDPTSAGFRFDGRIDQPSLWNTPNCVWVGLNDINNVNCGGTPACDPI